MSWDILLDKKINKNILWHKSFTKNLLGAFFEDISLSFLSENAMTILKTAILLNIYELLTQKGYDKKQT